MATVFACGLGIASTSRKGEFLEVFYPQPLCNLQKNEAEILFTALEQAGLSTAPEENTVYTLESSQAQQLYSVLCEKKLMRTSTWPGEISGADKQAVFTLLARDTALNSVPEAYLKLHLLSHRLVKPHGMSLDGIFGCLPNVAWTSRGPIDLDELPQAQLEARASGDWLSVNSIDKFPPMCDYIAPHGTRIADTARVRLGAYVGAGTTIMHEGFINFNAGTAGTSMIEGRISAGVFVGEGSDLGGGSSTMGTLSGGGNVIISVGENCLIGANAGIGIALGDRCIVEAGLYVTAGTKVNVLDENNQRVDEIKARELSGKSDLLFRRNSVTGAVECKTNKTVVELNNMLHANN